MVVVFIAHYEKFLVIFQGLSQVSHPLWKPLQPLQAELIFLPLCLLSMPPFVRTQHPLGHVFVPALQLQEWFSLFVMLQQQLGSLAQYRCPVTDSEFQSHWVWISKICLGIRETVSASQGQMSRVLLVSVLLMPVTSGQTQTCAKLMCHWEKKKCLSTDYLIPPGELDSFLCHFRNGKMATKVIHKMRGERTQKVSLWDVRKSEKSSGVNQDYWVFCFTSMPYLTATLKLQGMTTPVKESTVQWARAWTGLAFQLLPKGKMDQRYVVIQSLSHIWPLVTPWTAAHQASLSITSFWSLLKLMSIESVIPPNHLILCRPLLLLSSIFPSIRVFSNKSALCIRWPNYWSFSVSPSSEYAGLISFRIDWFDLLAVQRTLQHPSAAPQFESINSLAHSLLYGPTLTFVQDYWENP